jgi:hypothetical protein
VAPGTGGGRVVGLARPLSGPAMIALRQVSRSLSVSPVEPGNRHEVQPRTARAAAVQETKPWRQARRCATQSRGDRFVVPAAQGGADRHHALA